MYDEWLDEVEDGNMVGVMMIDLSAAFDMVDHPLLLQKLYLVWKMEHLLGWRVTWKKRTHRVMVVDGCLWPLIKIDC